ncbi:hypothetical protein BGX38DRAFT_1161911 [Terfezia claveryi]|nr:hypothetical protein BGX38DRAFT_1161911 [Terfezia claveryi]
MILLALVVPLIICQLGSTQKLTACHQEKVSILQSVGMNSTVFRLWYVQLLQKTVVGPRDPSTLVWYSKWVAEAIVKRC